VAIWGLGELDLAEGSTLNQVENEALRLGPYRLDQV